jgi:hypothetical protein
VFLRENVEGLEDRLKKRKHLMRISDGTPSSETGNVGDCAAHKDE